MASFGAEVRRRRKAAGLTLEKLAEQSNLSPHYLSGIENGRRDPSLSTILAIARGLGVAPGDLLGRTGKLSPAGLEAGRLFDQAPEGVKEGILTILRAMQRREKP
ncbi:MAG TPA: helix-turn-helix transcriptional regulator [Polyangiaceae bacterium]|nr:helix-turn-helix transcriptional regulator [Polyangiaceae bacterium]